MSDIKENVKSLFTIEVGKLVTFCNPLLPVTRLVGTYHSVFVTLIVTHYWVAVEYAAALQCSALQAKRVVTSNNKPD